MSPIARFGWKRLASNANGAANGEWGPSKLKFPKPHTRTAEIQPPKSSRRCLLGLAVVLGSLPGRAAATPRHAMQSFFEVDDFWRAPSNHQSNALAPITGLPRVGSRQVGVEVGCVALLGPTPSSSAAVLFSAACSIGVSIPSEDRSALRGVLTYGVAWGPRVCDLEPKLSKILGRVV